MTSLVNDSNRERWRKNLANSIALALEAHDDLLRARRENMDESFIKTYRHIYLNALVTVREWLEIGGIEPETAETIVNAL